MLNSIRSKQTADLMDCAGNVSSYVLQPLTPGDCMYVLSLALKEFCLTKGDSTFLRNICTGGGWVQLTSWGTITLMKGGGSCQIDQVRSRQWCDQWPPQCLPAIIAAPVWPAPVPASHLSTLCPGPVASLIVTSRWNTTWLRWWVSPEPQ